uniref:Dynein regulatory complex subunit 5 n=1 Tax=Macrostomum lignano TaxID=282301 RepID=A0A1I8IXH7_9PLAT
MSSKPQTPAPDGEEADQTAAAAEAAAEGDEAPPSRASGRSKKSQSQAAGSTRQQTEAGANEDAEEADASAGDAEDAAGGDPDAAAEDEDLPEQEVQEDPALDRRNIRKIIAEDPEWNLATVPGLAELSLKGLVANFEYNSDVVNRVDPAQQAKLLKRLPVDVSKKVTGPLIRDEGYWRRVCKARWPVCDVSQYDGSWKRMHFERDLQEVIEFFVPGSTDPTQLSESLILAGRSSAGSSSISCCRRSPTTPPGDEAGSDHGSDTENELDNSHLDFGPLLPQLPNLTELRLCYTVRDCGMNFEWSLFNFTAKDCLKLAEAVAACRQLRVLQLSRSKVDCDRCRILISRLLDHPGLEELDLSGGPCARKFLNGHSKLVRLDVTDNLVRAQGAQALAHALLKNRTLRQLSLRLNRMGDDGGQAIGKALIRNDVLEDVDISSNELTEPTATVLAQVIVQNKTLQRLNLCNNRLGADGGKQLQEAWSGTTPCWRWTCASPSAARNPSTRISQVLEKNQERRRNDRTSSHR